MEIIKQIAEEIFEEIKEVRRHLHSQPEVSFCEYKTSDYICAYLDRLGIPYQRDIAKTGVVGLLMTNEKAKTLLIRADMDALPIQEVSECTFKSENDGVMHACGHDAHMAVLLGTATILSRLKDKLACNVKFVFQPAEETEGGAEPMIAAGILENPHVDGAVGGHVMNHVPAGKILVKYGEMMASPDDFVVTIHGRGGHGALPHECVDPIAIGVQILNAWNALSARYTNPLEKHLISVNIFQAGTSYNVIPDEAYISGTVRVFDENIRQKLAIRMEEIANNLSETFGATCDFTYNFRYPPLVNDKNMTDAVKQSAEHILGAANVIEGTTPSMVGEDFSYFGRHVPATFINFGSGNETMGITMPLHSANFLIDETCLKTGMMVMSQFAMDFGR